MNWLVPTLMIGLSTAALLDCWRLPRPMVPGPPALVWSALFVALPGLAAVAWFLARYLSDVPSVPELSPARIIGPDDDPDFLRSIEPRHGEGA